MKTGFGVIGVGVHGERHVIVYSSHRDVNLVAICDQNEKRSKKIAQKYHVETYYTDYRKLLDDPRIAAVSVVTPDFAHREIVVAAAEKGKHILVEKPFATTIEDAEAMVDAVTKNKVKLMVNLSNRWNPEFYMVKKSIEEGKIGIPLLIYLRCYDTIDCPLGLPWASKTSLLWWLGSHLVDLAMWFMNDEVQRVYGVARSKVLKEKGVNTPDFFEIMLEFKRGGVAVIELHWILPESFPTSNNFECELIGSEGSISTDLEMHRAVALYTKDKIIYPDLFMVTEIYGEHLGFPFRSIEYFVDCIVNNRQPMVGYKEGLLNTRILCHIDKSVKTRSIIELK